MCGLCICLRFSMGCLWRGTCDPDLSGHQFNSDTDRFIYRQRWCLCCRKLENAGWQDTEKDYGLKCSGGCAGNCSYLIQYHRAKLHQLLWGGHDCGICGIFQNRMFYLSAACSHRTGHDNLCGTKCRCRQLSADQKGSHILSLPVRCAGFWRRYGFDDGTRNGVRLVFERPIGH